MFVDVAYEPVSEQRRRQPQSIAPLDGASNLDFKRKEHRMARQWYYQVDGQIIGPVRGSELRAKVADGVIVAGTLIRQGDTGEMGKSLACQVVVGFPDAAVQSAVRECSSRVTFAVARVHVRDNGAL